MVVHRRWCGLLNHGRGVEPIWPHKFHFLVEEAQGLHLLQHLHTTGIDHKATVDEICPRGFYLRQEGPEVNVDRFDTVMPNDLQLELACVGYKDICNALTVELTVIQHIDFLKSQALGPSRRGCSLNVIRRERPEIVDFP